MNNDSGMFRTRNRSHSFKIILEQLVIATVSLETFSLRTKENIVSLASTKSTPIAQCKDITGPASISCDLSIITEQLVFIPASLQPVSSWTTSPELVSSSWNN